MMKIKALFGVIGEKLKEKSPLVTKERFHREKDHLQQAIVINRASVGQLANELEDTKQELNEDLDETDVLLATKNKKIAQLYKNNRRLRDQLRETNRLIRILSNNDNSPTSWKSRLWQNTGKLTLIGLAATYQGGYHHGFATRCQSNSNQDSSRHFQTTQLINYQGNSVNYNSTHSWEINQLTPNEICSSSPLQNFYNQLDNKPRHSDLVTQNNNLFSQLKQRPNITLTEYNNLLNNQKPADLPQDWKEQLSKLRTEITELQQRPTSEDYNKLKDNQRPIDLPLNWKSELANIPDLKKKLQKQKEKINNLKSRPNKTELAQKINEAVVQEAEKYKDFINPTDTTKIIEKAQAQGYRFKQNDIDEAIEINNQIWIDKGLINPFNSTELEKAELVDKSEYEQLRKERDNRPNITLNKHEELVNQKKKVQTDLTEWTNAFPNSTANQVKQELVKVNKDKYQAKTDLNKWIDTFGNQTPEKAKQNLEQKNQEHNKLLVDHNELKTSFAKTQQQVKKQSNFIRSVLPTLISAGVASRFSFKVGQKHKEYEFEEKYLKDIQTGIEILIKQKKEARQKQEQAEQERDYWQNQAQNNHSASGNSSNKSDNIQTKTEIIRQNNEREIIQQLNDSLKLNFSQTPTLPQVISRIQKLIKKDPLTPISESVWEELNQIPENVTQLENTPFGEDLAVIKSLELTSLEELFPGQVDSAFKEQIQQATNYQQVVSVRQAFLAKHLGQKIMIQKPFIQSQNELVIKPNKEKIIWIALLMMSLLTIGGLLAKFKKKNSKKSFKK